MATDTIELPRQTRGGTDELGLEIRANSFDEAENTIDIVWSTGAKVRRFTWRDGAIDEELSMMPAHVRLNRLNVGAPFLNTHSAYDLRDIIGSVIPGTAKIEAGRGVATIKLSQRTEAAGIVQDIRDGVIRNISVGYRVHAVEKTEGQEGDVPLWRVIDWEPMEISAVPVPADPGARVRSADGAGSKETFPCVVTRHDADPATTPAASPASQGEPTMSNGVPAGTQAGGNDEVRAAPVATVVPAAPIAAAPTVDVAAERAEATRAERQRSNEIRDLARRAGMDDAAVVAAIDGNVTADAFRAQAFDHMASAAERVQTDPTRIQVGDNTVARREAVVGALMHRHDPGRNKLTPEQRDFRGLSLIELARNLLEAGGVGTRGMAPSEVATRAFHSSSDFPLILEGVTNKSLRAAYDVYPRTFLDFCRQITARDFKVQNRYQLGEAPQLEKVNESGAFKRGTLTESKQTIKVETYGKVVGITRQVIVNDDLGAFTRIPAMFGTSIATLESDIVWGLITANGNMGDGNPLFHANHKNLAAGGALSVATIGATRTLMRKQLGLDGKTKLNVRAQHLLVPSDIETQAEQLLRSIIVAEQAGNAVPSSIRSLNLVSEPRLADNSATAFYLAADPSTIDTLEYAYLEGNEGAYVETRMGFDVDGMEVKCRLDFGAAVIDFRGMAKNPGA